MTDKRLHAVTVFCGSSPGTQPAFRCAAESLGKALSNTGRRLIYGGGDKGIMGVVSDTVLKYGGSVTGVIPAAMVAAGGEGSANPNGDISNLDSGQVQLRDNDSKVKTVSQIGFNQMTLAGLQNETIVVNSMHERKVTMADRGGAFIGLPGGFGTFEEIMEVVTWTQLRIHRKPVLVINVLKFFDPLKELVQIAVKSGFIQPQNAGLLIFVDGPSDESLHKDFDWGAESLRVIDEWNPPNWEGFDFKWTSGNEGVGSNGALNAT